MPTSLVPNVFPTESEQSDQGKSAEDERKVSGTGGLPVKKVAKGQKKVSGAGDVPVKKPAKAGVSEPREHNTSWPPVSTVLNTIW